MNRRVTLPPLESPMAKTIVDYQSRRGITWEDLALEIEVDADILRALVYEKWDITLTTLHRIARYFEWDAVDVGIVAMYVPKGVKEKEGRKNESKTKGPGAAEPSGDSGAVPRGHRGA